MTRTTHFTNIFNVCPYFSITYRHPPPNPLSHSSILKAGQGGTLRVALWVRPSQAGATHVYHPSNRSQPPQRPAVHRPHLCHRQGRLLHECPQNRHPRQIPRPPLRTPRRPRATHRRALPPPPPHLPRSP